MADRDVPDLSEHDVESVLVHLYRAEADREVSWRDRLDTTTNWAVTIIAAILAFAFSGEGVSHVVLIVGMIVGNIFLVIEARRFQRYGVWRDRVRMLQEHLFVAILDPGSEPDDAEWRQRLSEDYRNPKLTMPLTAALAHRLRRVYLPLLVGLLVAWLFRLASADGTLVEAAAVDGLPGEFVVPIVLFGYVALFAIGFWPDLRSTREVAERKT